MAITSGVRAPRGQVTVGGQSFNIISAQVNQEATRQSSTMSATCALREFPGGDAFFAGLSDNAGAVTIAGASLCTGEWDTIRIDYQTTLVHLSGRDKSIKLHEHKSSETFLNKSRAEVVQEIAKRNGLTAQVDKLHGGQKALLAGKTYQIDWTKLTDGVSDAALLSKLAEQSGAKWWVKGDTLYFRAEGGQTSNYTVRYSGGSSFGPAHSDAKSISISRNMQAAKTITVNVKSWNQKKKETISSTKTVQSHGGQKALLGGGKNVPVGAPPSLPLTIPGEGGGQGSPGSGSGSETLTYDYRTPGLGQEYADALAGNKANEHARHELTVEVYLPGDPSIDIAMGLQLIGTAFAQTFEIDEINHQLAHDGYDMTITARSATIGRTAS